ncbi:hypothetical protein HDU97_005288 [Phlyctochytrium planicorne]|nr:hypothetical protein HDU97_005288 [Phlyctochytrium planicorne]
MTETWFKWGRRRETSNGNGNGGNGNNGSGGGGVGVAGGGGNNGGKNQASYYHVEPVPPPPPPPLSTTQVLPPPSSLSPTDTPGRARSFTSSNSSGIYLHPSSPSPLPHASDASFVSSNLSPYPQVSFGNSGNIGYAQNSTADSINSSNQNNNNNHSSSNFSNPHPSTLSLPSANPSSNSPQHYVSDANSEWKQQQTLQPQGPVFSVREWMQPLRPVDPTQRPVHTRFHVTKELNQPPFRPTISSPITSSPEDSPSQQQQQNHEKKNLQGSGQGHNIFGTIRVKGWLEKIRALCGAKFRNTPSRAGGSNGIGTNSGASTASIASGNSGHRRRRKKGKSGNRGRKRRSSASSSVTSSPRASGSSYRGMVGREPSINGPSGGNHLGNVSTGGGYVGSKVRRKAAGSASFSSSGPVIPAASFSSSRSSSPSSSFSLGRGGDGNEGAWQHHPHGHGRGAFYGHSVGISTERTPTRASVTTGNTTGAIVSGPSANNLMASAGLMASGTLESSRVSFVSDFPTGGRRSLLSGETRTVASSFGPMSMTDPLNDFSDVLDAISASEATSGVAGGEDPEAEDNDEDGSGSSLGDDTDDSGRDDDDVDDESRPEEGGVEDEVELIRQRRSSRRSERYHIRRVPLRNGGEGSERRDPVATTAEPLADALGSVDLERDDSQSTGVLSSSPSTRALTQPPLPVSRSPYTGSSAGVTFAIPPSLSASPLPSTMSFGPMNESGRSSNRAPRAHSRMSRRASVKSISTIATSRSMAHTTSQQGWTTIGGGALGSATSPIQPPQPHLHQLQTSSSSVLSSPAVLSPSSTFSASSPSFPLSNLQPPTNPSLMGLAPASSTSSSIPASTTASNASMAAQYYAFEPKQVASASTGFASAFAAVHHRPHRPSSIHSVNTIGNRAALIADPMLLSSSTSLFPHANAPSPPPPGSSPVPPMTSQSPAPLLLSSSSSSTLSRSSSSSSISSTSSSRRRRTNRNLQRHSSTLSQQRPPSTTSSSAPRPRTAPSLSSIRGIPPASIMNGERGEREIERERERIERQGGIVLPGHVTFGVSTQQQHHQQQQVTSSSSRHVVGDRADTPSIHTAMSFGEKSVETCPRNVFARSFNGKPYEVILNVDGSLRTIAVATSGVYGNNSDDKIYSRNYSRADIDLASLRHSLL